MENVTYCSYCNWTSGPELLNVTLSSMSNNIFEILRRKAYLFLTIMNYFSVPQYIVCFLGNALTITSVVKFDYLHKKSTNLLILSLSIADGLLGELFFHFPLLILSLIKCLVPKH